MECIQLFWSSDACSILGGCYSVNWQVFLNVSWWLDAPTWLKRWFNSPGVRSKFSCVKQPLDSRQASTQSTSHDSILYQTHDVLLLFHIHRGFSSERYIIRVHDQKTQWVYCARGGGHDERASAARLIVVHSAGCSQPRRVQSLMLLSMTSASSSTELAWGYRPAWFAQGHTSLPLPLPLPLPLHACFAFPRSHYAHISRYDTSL